MRRWISSVGRITMAVLVGVVVGNPILLYFIQERLIFYPESINEGNRRVIKKHYRLVEETTFDMDGQARLHGWLQQSPGGGRRPLLIYFGGNAEDISFLPAAADRAKGWSLLALNYRGYGLSSGTPGQQAIFADALRIFDAAALREDVDAGTIAVMGRSLGSGVAAYLAAHRPVRAVVLVTPYDSVASLAREKLWFVPVSLILKHPFDSLALAPKIDKPALFLVAREDETVPLPHSRRLFDAWAGPKKWHLAARENHDTVEFDPDYWRVIADFLQGAAKPASAGAPPRS